LLRIPRLRFGGINEELFAESAGIQATRAATNLRMAQQALEHAIEVVVAIGELLVCDCAGHSVADQEHAQLHLVALLSAPARRSAL